MSIDKAITYLKKKAPKGEFLAYINPKEAAMLKKAGGSGELVNGIPSYRSAKGMASKEKSRSYKSPSKSPSRSLRGPQELGTSTRTVNRITAPPPTTYIGGKKYNVTPNNRDERNRAELKQQLMRQPLGGNRIDKFGNTKKSLFRGGGGGIGSLLASLFGLAMGIPGLGLLTGGFGKLKKGLGSLGDTLGDFREKTTGFKTQAEYDQAMFDRRQQKRLDKLFAAKDRGYNQIGFGDFTKKTMDFTPGQQAKIDDLLAQGYTPSTARNVLTGRDLKGFTESRGLQTPQTFSDPFANTVGTTTKVNNPSNDAVSYVPFSNYGKAAAATGTTVDGVPLEEFVKNAAIAPTPVEQYKNKAYTGIQENVGKPISNFLNNLMNADKIAALENEYGSKYGITNTAGGISSDARHMAAMNELSKSLSPMNNRVGEFIGDTGAFLGGAINEIPALFRGLDSKNLGEIKEDIIANYKGSFGTPNQTTAEQIYGDVFEGSTPVQTASLFADGGLASMFTRRG